MTQTEAAKLVFMLSTMLANPAWSPEQIALWTDTLIDRPEPYGTCVRGVQLLIQTWREPRQPRFGELLDCIHEISGDRLPSPDAAWNTLIHGDRESLPMEAKIALGNIGGWQRVGYAQEREYGWLKREFVAQYDAQIQKSAARQFQRPAGAQTALPERKRGELTRITLGGKPDGTK